MIHKVMLAIFIASACTFAGSAGARPLADAPTITAFTPNHGPQGTRVTIYGHNFAGARVFFDTIEANPGDLTMDANGTHLYVKIPSEVSEGWTGAIKITTDGGTVMTPGSFTVKTVVAKPIPRPHIWSFSPMRAKIGGKVIIRGSNLGGTQWVKFGGVKATFTVPKTTLIIAHVPKHAHTGAIMLKTSAGMATKATRFVVVPAV